MQQSGIMNDLGQGFNPNGGVMTVRELEEQRRKDGKCIRCGQETHKKRLFKMVPITVHGRVLEGRCLHCDPLDPRRDQGIIPAETRPATEEDIARFNRSQAILQFQTESFRRNSSRHLLNEDGRRPSLNNVTPSPGTPRLTHDGLGQTPRGGIAPMPPITPSSENGNSNFSSASIGLRPTPPPRPPITHSSRQLHDSFSHQDSMHSIGSANFHENSDETIPLIEDTLGRRDVIGESAVHPAAPTFNDHHGRRNSTRSINSNRSATSGTGSSIHNYPPVKHGILDRGGLIPLPTIEGSRFHGSPASPQVGTSSEAGHIQVSSRSVSLESELSAISHEHYEISDREPSARNLRPTQCYIEEDPGLQQIQGAGSDYVEIISVMREYSNVSSVQSMGMEELSNLHLLPEDSDTLADIGGIHAIVEAMRAFPGDVDLQINGCRAMWNASGTTRNQIDFVEAGALDIVLQNMERFLEDSQVQEQAIATLANLAAVENNLAPMIENGAVPRVVEAMERHAENSEVQSKGISVVINLASHLTTLKKTIMEMGGGVAVVLSMNKHHENEEIQEKGLRALRNLSANCDENKLALASCGGVDAVITAMRDHRDSSGVQAAGSWTLSNLAGSADVKVMIGDNGGIDVVIRAIWVHFEDVSVVEWCCRALYTLSLDPRNSAIMLDVGGIKAAVHAMQAQGNSSAVQEMGCAVLCNIGTDKESKMEIVDEAALDAINLAMVVFTDDVKVQERACQVLLRLAIEENLMSIYASQCMPLARTAAEKFPANCNETARELMHLLEVFAANYEHMHPVPVQGVP